MHITRGIFGLRALLSCGFIAVALVGRASIAAAQCGGSWTQRNPLTAPSVRASLAMAYDAARGVSVIFGGAAPGVYFDETWVWDGASWTHLNPATSPDKRYAHTMAYDSAREVVVLFGGNVAGAGHFGNAETWEWDGTNWFKKTPAHAPPARFNAAMAYDAARNRVVLFGGYNDNDIPIGDTWEWDGVDWIERSPTNSPTPRPGSAMAFDAARGVTVLFGGYFGSSAVVSDETWEWNGTDWLLQHPSPVPPGRAHHAMAYDAGRGVTVLFGGAIGAGSDNDTWEWDGANWFERQPSTAPSPRVVSGMAYDANRSTTVLFGGSTGVRNNETWEWIGPSPAISPQPGDQNVSLGSVAIFSVAATGPDSLNFRWHRDGVPLADGGAIAGATSATLTIGPTAVSDSGTYACLVSNPCGNNLSRAAHLDVDDPCQAADASGDCNGNGVLDSCEIAADASIDCNGNSVLDSCEIAADTSLDADGNGTLDACEASPGPGSIDEVGSTPCGLCGGGMTAMMPLLLAAIMTAYRRRNF
jgi:hypothetical protein